MTQFDVQLRMAKKEGNFDILGASADEADAVIDRQIAALEGLNPPVGAENYKKEMMAAFEAVKAVIDEGREYSRLGRPYKQTELHRLDREYGTVRLELSGQLKNVAAAQAEFLDATNR